MVPSSWIRSLRVALCLAAVLAPARSEAGFLGVLDVPGIPGESLTPLPDQIEVLSYSLGVTPVPSAKAIASCSAKRVALANSISVSVASIKHGGTGSDAGQPQEDVAFAFAAIQISYAKPDGSPSDATNANWTVCDKTF